MKRILAILLLIFISLFLLTGCETYAQKEFKAEYDQIPQYSTKGYTKDEIAQYKQLISEKEIAKGKYDLAAIVEIKGLLETLDSLVQDRISEIENKIEDEKSLKRAEQVRIDRIQTAIKRGMTESKVQVDQKGYTCDVLIYTWPGIHGTNAEIEFDYSTYYEGDIVKIPSQANTDCIIPVLFIITNTTQNDMFTSKISAILSSRFGLTNAQYSRATGDFTNNIIFNEPEYEKYWDTPSNSQSITWSTPTKKGDEHRETGYIVIQKFYTPANPSGDESLIPDGGMTLNLGISMDSAAMGYQYFTARINPK